MKKLVMTTLMIMYALCATAKPKPLKVYILAGQSNMTGMVSTNTLEHIKMVPETATQFADMFDKNGNPVVLDDVYVSCWDKGYELKGKLKPGYGGGSNWDRIGPEYAFGIYMHKKLKEPFLIIKTAQGGKSLFYDFRPPSAGTWTPPEGHPDLIKLEDLPELPIPKKLDLPDDYTPGEDVKVKTRHMGLKKFKGAEIGEVNGIYPIYLLSAPKGQLKGDPFLQGDLILGVDGSGFREDPIEQWRDAFLSSRSADGDLMITITRWRKGKIETFDFDICDTLEGGRDSLPQHIVEMKAEAVEREKQKGLFYRNMVDHVKAVLKDVKKYHPAYDSEAGYEIKGFVWFQGYNDMVKRDVYPNRDKPRGYEQYTWLQDHLIRDLRKDLNVPDMPAVIGVMGLGGISTDPDKYMTHFQAAQAATADSPEFKGTVAAVQTGKYWDHDLAALQEKVGSLYGKWRGLVKEGWKEMVDANGKPLFSKQPTFEEFSNAFSTEAERELLKKATSDAGFHYMGSGKIMAGIGKGFAEAMIELNEKRP